MTTIHINQGYDTDNQLLELLQSKIPEDWKVDIIFKSMVEGSEDKFNYEQLFYNDGRYYSNGQMIYITAKLERYGTNTYEVESNQLKRLRDIFNRVQYLATVTPKEVLRFDERPLIEENKNRYNDEWGSHCHHHHPEERPAFRRYLVERDSFGSEYANWCWSCSEKAKAHEQLVELCPQLWDECRCGKKQPQLQSFQDPDEGHNGPTYERCDDCAKRFWDRWHAENAYDDDYYD